MLCSTITGENTNQNKQTKKKHGFLALQDYEVTVLAFIAKYEIQWIVYFNYNGLSALFAKEGIQKIVLCNSRRPCSGNLFS